MFRVILAMSNKRKDVIDFLDSLSKDVMFHIAKCSMYGDSLGRYNHWVRELSIWISDANDKTCKPKGKKLTPREYADTIFDKLGTSEADARVNLHTLQRYNSRFGDEAYPFVPVDDDMISRMYTASKAVISQFSNLLSTQNDLDQHDIEQELHKVLDPKCL